MFARQLAAGMFLGAYVFSSSLVLSSMRKSSSRSKAFFKACIFAAFQLFAKALPPGIFVHVDTSEVKLYAYKQIFNHGPSSKKPASAATAELQTVTEVKSTQEAQNRSRKSKWIFPKTAVKLYRTSTSLGDHVFPGLQVMRRSTVSYSCSPGNWLQGCSWERTCSAAA